jgi:hypothetical protein
MTSIEALDGLTHVENNPMGLVQSTKELADLQAERVFEWLLLWRHYMHPNAPRD